MPALSHVLLSLPASNTIEWACYALRVEFLLTTYKHYQTRLCQCYLFVCTYVSIFTTHLHASASQKGGLMHVLTYVDVFYSYETL